MDYTLILASGTGQRLSPLTDKVHKALIPIHGVPNLCRILTFANKANISHHFIITLESERENFLSVVRNFDNVDVFSLKNSFIENKNNSVSLEHLITESRILDITDDDSNVFIIDSDTYLTRNVFNDSFSGTQYLLQFRENEWVPIPDSTGHGILYIQKNSTGLAISGVSVWKRKQLRRLYYGLKGRRSDNFYYDDVINGDREILQSMKYEKRKPFMLEYDTVSDLIKQNLMAPEEIATLLSDDDKITPLKSMSNNSFLITYRHEEVVCRIEGKTTWSMDREQERRITDYASHVLRISPESQFVNEIKFTRYLKDTSMLSKEDILNKTEVYQKLFEVLSIVHNSPVPDIKFIHPVHKVEQYDKVLEDNCISSIWSKKETEFFFQKIRENEGDCVTLVHRDLVVPNILIDSNLSKVWLIDWEYSGILSAYWDIGCLASELEFEFNIPRSEVFEDFLCFYHCQKIEDLSISKMRLWSCIVDFVWSKWAEAKIPEGEEYRIYARLRHNAAISNLEENPYEGI